MIGLQHSFISQTFFHNLKEIYIRLIAEVPGVALEHKRKCLNITFFLGGVLSPEEGRSLRLGEARRTRRSWEVSNLEEVLEVEGANILGFHTFSKEAKALCKYLLNIYRNSKR